MSLDVLFSSEVYIPVLLALGTYIGLWVLKNIGIVHLQKISVTTENYIDDLVLNVLGVTRHFFILGVALFAGFQALHLDKTHGHYADYVFVILLAIQTIIWGNEAVRSWVEITIQRKNNDPSVRTSLGFIGVILKFALITVVILFALNNLGVNVTTFIAGLGVGGIAIALATQNILGDLFSSLSIVLDKPFVVGDFVSLGAETGTIEHVGLKTTRIRSLSGEQIIVSNSDLLRSKIRNFKRMQERRVNFKLGLTYSTKRDNLRKAPGIIESIIKKYDNTRFDRAHFLNYGAYSLGVDVVYIILSSDFNVYANTHEKILLEIGDAFDELGIQMAFPTQTIIVDKKED